MITNLKFSTVGWIFVALMVFTGSAIIGGAFITDQNVSAIEDTWNEFQTDLSEKARLESALRSSIGYGGMIHDFKNYVLRQDVMYRNNVEANISAAHAILHQYNDLVLSASEYVAIEDIEHVLDEYLKSLRLVEKLIKQPGISIVEIDKAVKVDDSPALRGLTTLRQEMRSDKSNTKKLSKSRIVADIRAAIGYGGMIHEFKNYVLRHDDASIEKINAKAKEASAAIEQYRNYDLTRAEIIAFRDIESTLFAYADQLSTIEGFSAENISALDIDSMVRIDDIPLLRGLHILDREINAQVNRDSRRVTQTLQMVGQTIQLGTWGVVIIIVIVIFIIIWLFQAQIIQPIMQLTKNMSMLANNKLDIEISAHHQQNEVGQMARSILFFKKNLIKRREAEEKLSVARESAEKAMNRAEANEQLVSSILNTVRDGIITIDSSGIIETFNPGANDIFGYRAHEVIGKNISILMPEPHRSAHDGYLKKFMDGNSTRDQGAPIEQIALRKNGETFPAEITLNTVHVADKIKFTGLLRDITERKKWEEEIKQMAMSDPLTGLANRNRYNQRLQETVKQASRFNTHFALMQIDLDKFKPVNDTYGHPVGDALLQQVAKILLSSCRDVDTVARLGGDEFSIILNGINRPEDVVISAKRIIEKLSHPIMIENHDIKIGASIGISYYPDDSEDIEELFGMADKALYSSKQEGRNTYQIYSQMKIVPGSN